jgi:N-acylglucosamine 2-epimerase
MNPQTQARHLALYRDGLLHDTVPFWMKHGLDREFGGLRNYLDADGSVYNDDKAVWQTGRFAWLTGLLYNDVEKRPEWLEASRSCVEFLERHCFDTDGRIFFQVTRDGRPLRKRRYIDTESFGVMALSEYALAIGDDARRRRAIDVYKLILQHYRHPDLLPPKYFPQTRGFRGHGGTMMLFAITQQLRRLGEDPLYDSVIDEATRNVRELFMHPEIPALLETVAPDGSQLPGPVGRCVNPGHAIETAWFLMEEGDHRGDRSLIDTGCTILDWSLALGWDEKFGGLLNFVDVEGKPLEQYEHDMKFAWPHNEAIVACLMAYLLTGKAEYATWYERIHDWAYAHFPDREHGDWFKYLHRDGTISSTAKGTHWVSCFHLPRMQWKCWRLLERALGSGPEGKAGQVSTTAAAR